MVTQITPAGSAPVATPAATPAAARPAKAPGAPAAAANPRVQAAAVAQVNRHLADSKTDLKLHVDSGSGRTVFQVVKEGTGQVLLQVPSEEVLGLSRRVREILSQNGGAGALVDKEG